MTPMFSWPMMTGESDGGFLYIRTSVPQMPATSILSRPPSSGTSGIGNSRNSIRLGPVRTAASTFSMALLRLILCKNTSRIKGGMGTITIPALQQMKRDGRKIVAVVAWDYQIARIADRAGVEIISAGDSVGVNLWGREDDSDITVDEMIIVCNAVRRGTEHALVSCDLPSRLLEKGVEVLKNAAQRLVEEAGADIVKVDRASELPDAVAAIARTGIPVFAQFEMTRHDTTESVVNAAKLL